MISEIAGGLIFCINGNEQVPLNIPGVSQELCQLLSLLEAGRFREVKGFANLPDDLLRLKGVFLGGSKTFAHCPNFQALVRELERLREMSRFPEFKIVLLAEGGILESSNLQLGLDLFRPTDEVWIQLDCSSLPYQARFEERSRRLDGSPLPYQSKFEERFHPLKGSQPPSQPEPKAVPPPPRQDDESFAQNILTLASRKWVVLQSAFYALHGEAPSDSEVKNYIRHLKKLKRCGAKIASIQVYSPAPKDPKRSQLKLKNLALIARRIREETSLPTEFF